MAERRWRGAALCIVVGCIVVGCVGFIACGGDDGTTGLTTLVPLAAPIPTLVPTASTAAPAAPATGTAPSSGDGLTLDGPWRPVDGITGVDTPGLFYELLPGVTAYLPLDEDIPAGIVWTLAARDVPIIEAYLQARSVYYRTVSVDPIDLDDEGWGVWYLGGPAVYLGRLDDLRAEGAVADLTEGVVLRPTVIGDERTDTTAIVFDCVIDGSVFVLPDGALAEGSRRGIDEVGFAARMQLIEGRWMVTQVGSQPEACW